MEYNGCLNEVMSDLEHVINKSRADKLLIFHPTRIIRAIIDYKIEHPNKLLESLVRESIDLGLSVYRKKRDCINKIGVLRNQILRSENEELLYLPLSQEKDSVTWNATNLTYSIQSAKSLNLQNKDILFIALGHGV